VEISVVDDGVEDIEPIHENGKQKNCPPFNKLVLAGRKGIVERYLGRNSMHPQDVYAELYEI